MKKIKILRIIDTLDTNYGGPSNTIIDSSKILSEKGYKVHILTHDRELGKKKIKDKNIKILNKGPSFTNYFLNFKITFWLKKNHSKYDFFIIHGIWRFHTLLARLFLKGRYFVFTHGMLDPYFGTELWKKLKKKLFWYLIEKKNLQEANTLLLTSENEKKSLSNTFVNTNGIKKTVISYGIKKNLFNKKNCLISFYNKYPKLKKKNFFLFLGRFHKKKGCEILLESVKTLKKQNIHIKILMVGPNNEYKTKLSDLVRRYKIEKNIILTNPLSGKLKWGAVYASQAMVLSSHGENFGVSIVESLSCGKPVLITNKVNIFKIILSYQAGLVSNDNAKSFYKILNKYLNLTNHQKKKYHTNSIKCFNENFNLTNSTNSLENLLEKYSKKKK